MPKLAQLGYSADEALALRACKFWRLLKAANKADVLSSQSMVQAIAMGMGNYDDKTRKQVFKSWDETLERDKFKPLVNKAKVNNQLAALAKLGVKVPKKLRDRVESWR